MAGAAGEGGRETCAGLAHELWSRQDGRRAATRSWLQSALDTFARVRTELDGKLETAGRSLQDQWKRDWAPVKQQEAVFNTKVARLAH